MTRDAHVPSVVTVTEDMATGGQIWTRLYARRNGFPQVIHSSKRFAGPTGLEEYVGYGIGMALTVLCARTARSSSAASSYFLQLLGRRFPLPQWMMPGHALRHPCRAARRQVQLHAADRIHPRFGLLIRQMAMFREIEP